MEEKIIYPAHLSEFLELWKKAEKRNDPKAQFELAKLYSANNNQSENVVMLLQKSAKLGYTDSIFALGVCYEKGYGIKQSYRKAISQYKHAEHHIADDLMNNPDPIGDAEAARISRYFNDEEYAAAVDEIMDFKDEDESIECISRKALSGDSQAQNALGFCYRYGQNINKNPDKSLYWFSKSAEQGYEAGMCHLAEMYVERKKYKEAAEWYRKYAHSRILWRNERLGW